MDNIIETTLNNLLCTIESVNTTVEEEIKYLNFPGYRLHKIIVSGNSDCDYPHHLEELMDLPLKVYSYLKDEKEDVFGGSELLEVKSYCNLDGNLVRFQLVMFIETYGFY